MTSDERKRLLEIANQIDQFRVMKEGWDYTAAITEKIRWLAGQGACGIEERTGNRCKSQCPSCLTWVPRTVPTSTEGYWPPDDAPHKNG